MSAHVATPGGGGGVARHVDLTDLPSAVGDPHTQYLLLAGRAGGQSAFGGTAAADNLTLQANTAGTGAGRILANSPIVFGAYSATTASYGFSYTAVETFSGGIIGGGLNFSGTITFDTVGTFVYESFRGAPTIHTAVNPGFNAYTVLQALPRFESGSGAGHNPVPPLILNAGARVNHGFTGTRTVSVVAAINFASTLSTSSTGTLNCSAFTGLTVAPKWSTAAFSTVNFGVIRAVHLQNPSVAPFGGSSAGTELATAIIGLDVDALSSFGTITKAAVRSAIAVATNAYFLLNNGNAHSDHGAGHIYFDDNAGTVYGGLGLASFDAWMSWQAAGVNKFRVFLSANSTSWYMSNPGSQRILLETSGLGTTGEINMNCLNWSVGAQTGAVGNQHFALVAGAKTVTVGGDYTQVLLTNSATLTIAVANANTYTWTINAISHALSGPGTVLTSGVVNVGGNPSHGSVNRFGIRVISNPTGGSGINAALWITAGLSRFDGRVDINRPIALGGGAAPTLGTIGGAGPTAAAQAQWVEIDINGVAHWIPAWT